MAAQDQTVMQQQNTDLQKQVELMQQAAAAQKIAMDATPKRPGYNSELDPATGKIKDSLQTKWGPDVAADQTALNEIRNRGMATGPSAWANMALGKQGLEEQGLKSKAEQQAGSAKAGAESSLAATYGLSPAAQERLAMSGQRDLLNTQQNVGMQGAQARADIGLQDQNQKNQFLMATPGFDFQNANLGLQNKQGNMQSDQFNIGNTLNENKYSNEQNMAAYQEQMKAWAANKQADATRNSGGGGKK